MEWGRDINVASDPRAVIPHRALVFELIGPAEKFESAASALGFEWLATERVAEGTDGVYDPSAEEGESGPASDESSSAASLYLTMPTEAGLQGLLGHWKKYVAGRNPITTEEKTWWALFAYLKDVRPWSAKDRIAPVVSRYIEELLREEPDRRVIVEMDLWFRTSTTDRIYAYEALAGLIASAQAEVLDTVLIEEIQYHAVLVSIPASVARDIAERHGLLAHADGIMMIRAQGSISDIPVSDSTEVQTLNLPVVSNKPCIGALIDGYPTAAHDYLDGRLVIIEQDVTGETTPVSARYHGTAMASLILHGDLHEEISTLDRRLAVVPVLVGANGKESIPTNKLPVGVIYRAIQALNKGTSDGSISKKQIVVVNHSICNTYAPFSGRPTPWAALLDHFGHKLNMLFVVSAGNI